MKKIVVILIFVVLIGSTGCEVIEDIQDNSYSDSGSSGSPAYVIVYLKNGGSEKFQYSGFYCNGNDYNMSLKDNSCTNHNILKSKLDRIIFYGKTYDKCTNRNNWEWKVEYSGGSVLRGWRSSYSYEHASGKDFNTNTSKTINFSNISSIRYYR